jgi:glycosyltransferase involved in cell wall biosynthesis
MPRETLTAATTNLDLVPVETLVKPENWAALTGEAPEQSLFYVVIPAHNEAKTIGSALDNLLKQHLPQKSKLLIHVVSNGSTDQTEAIVAGFGQENVRLTSLSQANKPIALNHARAQSPSDIVINMDADTFPTPNALAKIYALMRVNPSCVASSVLPQRIKGKKEGLLQQMQDFYDAMTRANGAIIGKVLAYRPALLPEFPINTGSEDTWTEFTAINLYGPDAVKFLGQHPESDVAALYRGTTTFKDYLRQLLRWESGFILLMNQNPHLWSACETANLAEQPDDIKEWLPFLKANYPDFDLSDKLAMYSLMQITRRLVKYQSVAKHFATGGSWTSPGSDRNL